MAEYKVVTNGSVIFNSKVMEQGRGTEGHITMIREVTEDGQEIPMSRPVLSNTRVG